MDDIIANTVSVKMLKGNPTLYEVEFKDGNVYKVKDEILIKGPLNFRVWFANTYKKVLKLGVDDWLTLVQYWLSIAIEMEYEPISDEEAIQETIISSLINAVQVASIEETVDRAGRIYVKDGKAYVPNTSILKIIDSEGYKITYEKLRMILQPYLSGVTQVIRIGNVLRRFWVFEVDKVGIIVKKPVSEIEEYDNKNNDISDTEGKDNISADNNTDSVVDKGQIEKEQEDEGNGDDEYETLWEEWENDRKTN